MAANINYQQDLLRFLGWNGPNDGPYFPTLLDSYSQCREQAEQQQHQDYLIIQREWQGFHNDRNAATQQMKDQERHGKELAILNKQLSSQYLAFSAQRFQQLLNSATVHGQQAMLLQAQADARYHNAINACYVAVRVLQRELSTALETQYGIPIVQKQHHGKSQGGAGRVGNRISRNLSGNRKRKTRGKKTRGKKKHRKKIHHKTHRKRCRIRNK